MYSYSIQIQTTYITIVTINIFKLRDRSEITKIAPVSFAMSPYR
jgi:hypothetical protein